MGGAEALLLERDELADDIQQFDRQFEEQQRTYTYKHDGIVETAHSIEEARSRCPVLGAMALELATALVELPRDDREDEQDSADWLKSMMAAETPRAAPTDTTVKVHHESQTVVAVEPAVQPSYEQQLPVRHHDELALSPVVEAAELSAVPAASHPPSRETGLAEAMSPSAIAPVEAGETQVAIVDTIMPVRERKIGDAASHIETDHAERQTIERAVEVISKPGDVEAEVPRPVARVNAKAERPSLTTKTIEPMTAAAITNRPEIIPQSLVSPESDILADADNTDEAAEVVQLQYQADEVETGLTQDTDAPMQTETPETVAVPVIEREPLLMTEVGESPVEAAEVLLQVLQEDDIVMDQAPLAQFAQQLERLPDIGMELSGAAVLERPVEVASLYAASKDAENATEYTAETYHELTTPSEAVHEVHATVVERLEMLTPEMSEAVSPRLEELVRAIQEMSRQLADTDSSQVEIAEAEQAMVEACQEVLRTLGIPVPDKLGREFARHMLLVEGLQRLQTEHTPTEDIDDGMHERKHFGPLQNWRRMMRCIRKKMPADYGLGRYAMLFGVETV